MLNNDDEWFSNTPEQKHKSLFVSIISIVFETGRIDNAILRAFTFLTPYK